MARTSDHVLQDHRERMAVLRSEWATRTQRHEEAVAFFQEAFERQAERRRRLGELHCQMQARIELSRKAAAHVQSWQPRQAAQAPIRSEDPLASGSVRKGKRAPLTNRQREVADLIALGLSNAEIARKLVLTKGTVANHVEHILNRLGCNNRAQIAVWVVEQGGQERTG